MSTQVLVFLAASLALLSLSRAALMLWQRARVRASGTPWKVLLGGLRIDALTLAALLVLPLLCAPWVGDSPLAQTITGAWLSFAWFLLCLTELSTPQFVIEYDTRPNRLYLVYLKHPKEVMAMLWRGYRALLLAVVVGIAALVWLGSRLWLAPPYAAWSSSSVLVNILLTLGAAALCTLAVRGTLKHRPINPSTVAFCGDAMVNALALNSLYSTLYATYSLKNERSSADVYGDLPQAEVHAQVCQNARLPAPGALDPAIPTLHQQNATHTPTRPRHIVLIVEESLGAQFVGHLNGKPGAESLTPELDKLADQAWTFTRAYATGTRSVRGLEALAAGFPPCYSEAALKLPDAQARFFTLAQLLKTQGYRTCFVYGGEAHFDNMQGFFLGNGFTELYERKSFSKPAFVGTWGVSDEDMFERVHAILDSAQEPCLILAFSVSNHTPWEYPEGRIQPQGDARSVENTVRYADWAIGQFFTRAQNASYWDDAVFLLAADHDARVGGQSHVPLKHFHIPALILGGGITPRRDDRRVSQIDFPVTLLSLAGISAAHPMIGHDLTLAHTGGRAMMQYNENYGYWHDDVLTVLQPHKPAVQFRYTPPDGYQPVVPDAALVQTALAHALWPGQVYRARQYTLPQLRLAANTLESRP